MRTADVFDAGKIVFYRIEVWAIGRQEQGSVSVFLSNGFRVFLFMERGIVPDDGGVQAQLFAKNVTRPIVDKIGIGGTREQQGRKEIFAALQSNWFGGDDFQNNRHALSCRMNALPDGSTHEVQSRIHQHKQDHLNRKSA